MVIFGRSICIREYKVKKDIIFKYENLKKLFEYFIELFMNEVKEIMFFFYIVIIGFFRKSKVNYLKEKEVFIILLFLNIWILCLNFVYCNNVFLCVGGCKGEIINLF